MTNIPDTRRLDRSLRYLAGIIERSHPEYIAHPFDVAGLVQTILPYRHHRRQLDVDSYEAYELLILQLLADPEHRLIVPDRVRDLVAAELQSQSPDVTVYRRFADEPIALSHDLGRLITDQVPAGGVPTHGPQRTEPSGSCRYCDSPLPEGRMITFCPTCGENLRVVRCGACNTELEPHWAFCVACGRRMTRATQ